MEKLAALKGKRLGCWCAPGPCHGEVLVAAAEWAAETQRPRGSRPDEVVVSDVAA